MLVAQPSIPSFPAFPCPHLHGEAPDRAVPSWLRQEFNMATTWGRPSGDPTDSTVLTLDVGNEGSPNAMERWWAHLTSPWMSPGSFGAWNGWALPVDEQDEPDLVGDTGMIAARHASPHGSRAYAVYVPPEARVRALPVVMMLHGCKQNPVDFARGTGMNRWARKIPCIVVYPQQTLRHNGLRCWNWFNPKHQQRGDGEPAILAGILHEVLVTYGGDPKRVYVAGLSAGGAMAAVLARAYPDLIAAVAVHSGVPADVAHDLPGALATMRGAHQNGVLAAQERALLAVQAAPRGQRAVPMIVLQGGADRTVASINAERLLTLHLPAAEPGAPVRSTTPAGRDMLRTVWKDSRGRVSGEQWDVPEAGHAWFGGDPAGSYTDPDGPDASGEILRFFLDHPRTTGA